MGGAQSTALDQERFAARFHLVTKRNLFEERGNFPEEHDPNELRAEVGDFADGKPTPHALAADPLVELGATAGVRLRLRCGCGGVA